MKSHIWIAIGVYVLLAIVRKQLRCERPMSELVQILSLTLFEKTPLIQAFSRNLEPLPDNVNRNQLSLFD